MEAGGEFVSAEQSIVNLHPPVGQRWFVEAVFVVEVRNNEFRTIHHFDRGTREPGFIAIHQRNNRRTREVEKSGEEQQSNSGMLSEQSDEAIEKMKAGCHEGGEGNNEALLLMGKSRSRHIWEARGSGQRCVRVSFFEGFGQEVFDPLDRAMMRGVQKRRPSKRGAVVREARDSPSNKSPAQPKASRIYQVASPLTASDQALPKPTETSGIKRPIPMMPPCTKEAKNAL
jgi:hypothetical protein